MFFRVSHRHRQQIKQKFMIAFGSRLFFFLKTTTRNKGSLALGAQKLLHPLEIVGFFVVPFVGDDDDDGVRRWFDVVFETPAELDSELMYFFCGQIARDR